ncbi:hypothetical protein DFA_09185 [Cavenderia fasciculata]|uniref:Uncharacterized protein n=1 Tax=Cavenderia fasciculata TaxID=261658 RepID=F4Q6X7_CACFS|nr:uncharacterized protein DFA_09185 [Cavenderia fasciculata]EGG16159.1 hypothetical protein DFA_09185 [Cavenderia fasciculata]|eukprot:XP_004352612.1 hypothetical protein DFA_09185 [Cavenderia fasciculata]
MEFKSSSISFIIMMMMIIQMYNSSLYVFGGIIPCSAPYPITFNPIGNVDGCSTGNPFIYTMNGNTMIDVNVAGWDASQGLRAPDKILYANQFHFTFSQGGKYRANWTYYDATDGTTVCQGTNNYPIDITKPTFQIGHPQCPYGATTVFLTDIQLFVRVTNSKNQVDLVANQPVTMYDKIGKFVAQGPVTLCDMVYVTQPKSNKMPTMVIVPQSVSSPGTLQIVNFQDYTSLVLYSPVDPTMPFDYNTTTGVFYNIKSLVGALTLMLEVESQQCGIQKVPVIVGWTKPSVSVEFKTFFPQCNSTHVQAFVTVAGVTNLKLTYGGNTVTSPFAVDVAILDPEIGWEDLDTGIQETKTYPLPTKAFNHPTYTVVENLFATPMNRTKLKFNYNGDFNNLRFEFATNQQLSTTILGDIVIDNITNTVTLPFSSDVGQTIVTSICDPFQVYITYQPAYVIPYVVSKTCLDPMDVVITNAHLFQLPLTMTTDDQGTEVTITSSDTGVFYDVPIDRLWKMNALYVNSTLFPSFQEQFKPAIDITPNVTLALFNVTGQDCGEASATAVFTYNNKVIETRTVQYTWQQVLGFPINQERCKDLVKVIAPLPNITISIENQPQCVESSGTIRFNYPTNVDYVSINGETLADISTYNLYPGNYSIIAGGSQTCSRSFNLTILPVDPSNIFKKYIIITPQQKNSCAGGNAQIELINATNTDVFTSFSISGNGEGVPPGTWSVSSRFPPYLLDFDHAYCGIGQVSFVVPTEPINLQFTKIPTHCASTISQGDGQIILLGETQGLGYSQGDYYHIPSRTFNGLVNQTYTFYLTRGSACTWTIQVSLGIDEYKLIPIIQPINGSIFALNNVTFPNAYVDVSQQTNPLWPSEPWSKSYLSPMSASSQTSVSFNKGCGASSTLSYNLYNNNNKPEPTVIIPPSCNTRQSRVVLNKTLTDSWRTITNAGFVLSNNDIVKGGELLNFYHKVTFESTDQPFTPYGVFFSDDFTYEVVNASCPGAHDGKLIIHSKNPSLSFFLMLGEGDIYFAFDNETSTFTGLFAYDYRLAVISDTCYGEFSFDVGNKDATKQPAKTSGTAICNSKDTKATVTISQIYESDPNYALNYVLNGVLYNQSTIELPAGTYTGHVNASTDFCLVANQTISFSVTKSPIIATLTPANCSVQVAITGGNSVNYTISLFDKSQQNIIERVDGLSNYVFYQVDVGDYTVIVTDETGCQSDTFTLTVVQCGDVSTATKTFQTSSFSSFVFDTDQESFNIKDNQ